MPITTTLYQNLKSPFTVIVLECLFISLLISGLLNYCKLVSIFLHLATVHCGQVYISIWIVLLNHGVLFVKTLVWIACHTDIYGTILDSPAHKCSWQGVRSDCVNIANLFFHIKILNTCTTLKKKSISITEPIYLLVLKLWMRWAWHHRHCI